jgi:23S rRNA (cytosine1962-C5)-methyltransferase
VLSAALARIAPPSERRVAVRVTADAARQLRAGHPWLFEASVTHLGHQGAPGDLAVVFDQRRRFVAVGLFDPTSPIRVRVLHHGRPATVDHGFWAERFDAAQARREPLQGSEATTGYRCVHGENDGFGGLVVDRYDATVVLKVYTPAWFAHLRTVLGPLIDRLDPERVVLRLGRGAQRHAPDGLGDGATVFGPPPAGPIRFAENGLVMEADVVRGQKTGHFLDQRDNRQRVRHLADGARVLDVFACTGGFTVHAAAGGARSVESVDLSAAALSLTERNLALNADLPPVAACAHRVNRGDAFVVLEDLAARGRRYDLVVVDPPSFAARQSQVPGALRAYGRLTDLALRVLVPGGVLVQASCTARVPAEEFVEVVRARAAAGGISLEELARTGHPVDHPIGFAEGAYLKAVVARRW